MFRDEDRNLEFVDEAKNWNKILKDGEVRVCHSPSFPIGHKDRPAIIVYSQGFGPYIMPTGHVEDGKDEWKKYKENVFIDDWKQEKFKQPSYANTGKLFLPDDVRIGIHRSFLTVHDYNRIVKPTIDRLADERLNTLFESFGLDYIIECIIDQ